VLSISPPYHPSSLLPALPHLRPFPPSLTLPPQGQVVGVIAATPDMANCPLGFAVPMDTLRGLVEQIMLYGRPMRPCMGITYAPPQVSQASGRFCPSFLRPSLCLPSRPRGTSDPPSGLANYIPCLRGYSPYSHTNTLFQSLSP
jgi:hypothetical protein